ncbi:lipopolysaccharide biosynthesis protein [Hominiventricola filiformis]|uniref:Polysaccharide biosynthesis protein n=1 Tax=Hominiventricola filiformis TaxID=2885352 RepID=A0AAE3A6D6_9FIRM|nr:hypothetical protein [Hominiventricola filiformis]MCC2125369.1 hypothetical protein [Hominiventricola filiformis]
MEKRNSLALMSSTISMAAQVIYLLVNFVLRRFFIQYFGMEILGINGVLADVLNTLSLAELGIQSAITFRLYEPLAKGRMDEVNEIVTLFRKLYWLIGCFFIVAGFVCMPFLGLVVKDVQLSMGYIRIAFFLQLMVSASTYFLAYKRTLLYADQKQYLCSLVDIVCNIGFAAAKFGIIICTGNYFFYLMVQIIQNVISNLIVHVICKRQYQNLNERAEVSAELKKNLFSDVKNVFTSKLATYVYGSTDNLVISAFISTVSVGYLSSYKYITSCLMSIVYYMMIPIQPMIGNYLVDESVERSRTLFRNYTFVRYFLAMILLIPAVCLSDAFISLWIGGDYTMNAMITYLLVADTYISIVYGPTGEYINARGLFAKEKKIMILAAVLNIVLSVAGTFVIGIYGVLLGTVVCQIVLWIGKSSIVFKDIFHMRPVEYLAYWLEQGKGLVLFILTAWIGRMFTASVLPEPGIVSFVVKGAVLVMFSFLVLTVCYRKTSGYGYVMRIKNMVLNKLKRGK